jgi:Domain of unknown function (DUF4145)
MIPKDGSWPNAGETPGINYTCGHAGCGCYVSSEKGWVYRWTGRPVAGIQICPNCKQPTFINFITGKQIPGVAPGGQVQKLPDGVGTLWSEIRTCAGAGSFTAAVLAGRTLLMHIAVTQGAPVGRSFLSYVDYLVDNHFAPPNSKVWVDRIRAHGNEANHEIFLKNESDAKEIIVFLEMLLKFIYEFPNLG